MTGTAYQNYFIWRATVGLIMLRLSPATTTGDVDGATDTGTGAKIQQQKRSWCNSCYATHQILHLMILKLNSNIWQWVEHLLLVMSHQLERW